MDEAQPGQSRTHTKQSQLPMKRMPRSIIGNLYHCAGTAAAATCLCSFLFLSRPIFRVLFYRFDLYVRSRVSRSLAQWIAFLPGIPRTIKLSHDKLLCIRDAVLGFSSSLCVFHDSEPASRVVGTVFSGRGSRMTSGTVLWAPESGTQQQK